MYRPQDPLADEEGLRAHGVEVEGQPLQLDPGHELGGHAVLRLGLREVGFLARILKSLNVLTMYRVTEQLLHFVVIKVETFGYPTEQQQ